MDVKDILDLMNTGKISAREYAVDVCEKVKQHEHLNSIKSFNRDFLLDSAQAADQKRQIGEGGYKSFTHGWRREAIRNFRKPIYFKCVP